MFANSLLAGPQRVKEWHALSKVGSLWCIDCDSKTANSAVLEALEKVVTNNLGMNMSQFYIEQQSFQNLIPNGRVSVSVGQHQAHVELVEVLQGRAKDSAQFHFNVEMRDVSYDGAVTGVSQLVFSVDDFNVESASAIRRSLHPLVQAEDNWLVDTPPQIVSIHREKELKETPTTFDLLQQALRFSPSIDLDSLRISFGVGARMALREITVSGWRQNINIVFFQTHGTTMYSGRTYLVNMGHVVLRR
jgi:hypothetical protein